MTPLLCEQQQPASDRCRIAPRPCAMLIGCRISAVREFDERVGVTALARTRDACRAVRAAPPQVPAAAQSMRGISQSPRRESRLG
jgi:hypothetical protein